MDHFKKNQVIFFLQSFFFFIINNQSIIDWENLITIWEKKKKVWIIRKKKIRWFLFLFLDLVFPKEWISGFVYIPKYHPTSPHARMKRVVESRKWHQLQISLCKNTLALFCLFSYIYVKQKSCHTLHNKANFFCT